MKLFVFVFLALIATIANANGNLPWLEPFYADIKHTLPKTAKYSHDGSVTTIGFRDGSYIVKGYDIEEASGKSAIAWLAEHDSEVQSFKENYDMDLFTSFRASGDIIFIDFADGSSLSREGENVFYSEGLAEEHKDQLIPLLFIFEEDIEYSLYKL